jgi:pseudouridine-5'-phosphate glycosidase
VRELLAVSPETREALDGGAPVVALETTLVAHGFPPRRGPEVGLESERRVRAAGAVPATIGVLDGQIRVGLDGSSLERFTSDARKAGPRDLAACAVQGVVGATTVGGTLAICGAVGIRVLGTGGLGGVHRGWTALPDVSADVGELARGQTLVVSSGIKSLLDVPATVEALETLGIPLLGFRTNELPRFYAAGGGPPVTRVESAGEAAEIAAAHWSLGRGGLLLANPPADSLDDVEPLLAAGLAEAARQGVTGQAVTPFVLSLLHEQSDGRTLDANARLVADNAGLAAEVAVALASQQSRHAD